VFVGLAEPGSLTVTISCSVTQLCVATPLITSICTTSGVKTTCITLCCVELSRVTKVMTGCVTAPG